jgi:hypothetical protein
MLTKDSRNDLKWAMQATLLEQANAINVKEARHFVKNFILKEATYEQLLNLAFNPFRDDVYLESEKLEPVAKMFVQESLEGRTGSKAISLLENIIYEGPKWNRVKGVGSRIVSGAKKANEKATSVAKSGVAKAIVGAKVAGQKIGKAAKVVGKIASKQASKLGQKAYEHPKSAVAIGAAAAGAAGYLVYRKMRAKGASKKEAAKAAAAASKNPDQKAKWQKKANE